MTPEEIQQAREHAQAALAYRPIHLKPATENEVMFARAVLALTEEQPAKPRRCDMFVGDGLRCLRPKGHDGRCLPIRSANEWASAKAAEQQPEPDSAIEEAQISYERFRQGWESSLRYAALSGALWGLIEGMLSCIDEKPSAANGTAPYGSREYWTLRFEAVKAEHEEHNVA
jgi:hypothetical protein